MLGVNEMQPRLDMAVNMWDAIVEKLEDSSQIYHIGSSGKHRNRENAEDVEVLAAVLDFMMTMWG